MTVLEEGACRSCGAKVYWVTMTATGKKMPVDADKIQVVTPDGLVVHGHQSHFATCPQANQWRKPKAEAKKDV